MNESIEKETCKETETFNEPSTSPMISFSSLSSLVSLSAQASPPISTESDETPKMKKPSVIREDYFPGELLSRVVSQICNLSGFESIQSSCLDTLTDVVRLFIEEVGYRSKLCSEHAGRSESHLLDVEWVLGEMGFHVSDLLCFLNKNRHVKPLEIFKKLPKFPVKSIPAGSIIHRHHRLFESSEELPKHIPSFLPKFPAKHTYCATPVSVEPIKDKKLLRKIKNKRKRQAEKSLLKLNKKLVKSDDNSDLNTTPSSGNRKKKTASSLTDAKSSSRTCVSIPKCTTLSEPTPLNQIDDSYYMTKSEPHHNQNDESHVAFSSNENNDFPESGNVSTTHTGSGLTLTLAQQKPKTIDVTEQTKKRARAEQIIGLSHKDGIVDQLPMESIHKKEELGQAI